ncbi:biliverdin-producing heme oxygenase [Xanthomonas sp. AmX2]|uniref:biliverdin-producing heme oxygenase n=1 Tax=Xanthomonas sp. TaxID=29446 RepID=UPI00197DE3FD|nr:biliverdin-producing heme oxygenase [Xanthomonas sp.]MBN6152771.1 biliverdin-producing heme oxygenase [Xanthomonas sp.]
MTSSTAGSAAPPVSRLLREATHDQHQAVEQLPAMRLLAQGRVSAAQYVDVLRRHHRVLAGWERQHAAWLATLADGDWHYLPRTPLLARDLAALRAAPAPAQAAPDAPDPAHRWGMLYVIEGSRLGGRVIARQLRAVLAELAPALSYFELGHADTASWRRFQQRLERALPGASQRQAAVDGARAMFAHFHTHLALETAA